MEGIYQGCRYTLIEVLDSVPSVVLEPTGEDNIVQNSAQGEARRFVQNNFTVPFFSEIKQQLHPVVSEFLGKEISSVLEEQITSSTQS